MYHRKAHLKAMLSIFFHFLNSNIDAISLSDGIFAFELEYGRMVDFSRIIWERHFNVWQWSSFLQLLIHSPHRWDNNYGIIQFDLKYLQR